MKRLRIAMLVGGVSVVAALAVGTALARNGDDDKFRAALNGYNEVTGPPSGSVSTTGRGTFEAELEGNTIQYTLTYSRLEGTATAAHIHFAQRHVAGGVIAFLCGGGGKPACPTPGGTVTGTIQAADIIGPAPQGIEPGSFAEAVRAMRAGATYVNVHSTPRWPDGEIRGQIDDRKGRGDKDKDDDKDEREDEDD
jgi:hypothetical protein